MLRKREFASEGKERAEPLHGVIAGCREQRNSRSNFQNASTDILIEIFLQAISTKDDLQGDDGDDKIIRFRSQFTRQGWAKMAPVNVSAVCQHWRAVALSSPSLWSTFVGYEKKGYSILPYQGNVASFPWEYLDVFLLRSKNAPFNLIIYLGCEPDMGYDRLLAAFNNNLPRLKTLNIVSTAFSASSKAWHIELANMPLIETLRLELRSHPREGSCAHIHLHLADTPVLHHLALTADYLVLHHDGHLVFQNLTHVFLSIRESWPELNTEPAVTGLSWHDCLLMMQASPSIEVFSAKDVIHRRLEGIMSSDNIQVQSHTVLSKLSTLYLGFEHNDGSLRHLLDNLYLPSLTELSLKSNIGAGPLCGLQALLSRSESIIRKFEVYGFDDEDVIGCLEHMPALQTLSISSITLFRPEFISRLTLTRNTRVCPKLEDICFYQCGDNLCYHDELSEMICSRWYNSTVADERCFKSVTFDNCFETLPYPYSDQLLKACREGLVIRGGMHVIDPDKYRNDDSDDEYHDSMSGYSSGL